MVRPRQDKKLSLGGQSQRESLWLITRNAPESKSGRFFEVVNGVLPSPLLPGIPDLYYNTVVTFASLFALLEMPTQGVGVGKQKKG